MASIQGIYIALFGRPADPVGLNYFNGITNNGQNLAEIGNLAGQPEYLNRFEGMNNAQIVTAIYQELFGRNPELAGLTFFTEQLNSGARTINDIAINILDGAQGADRELVDAKIAAADQFTAAVAADPDALAAYQGEAGIQFGQAFLNQIDEPTDTLTDEQVQAQVEAYGDGEVVPGVPGTPGDTFTLTASGTGVSGVDNITGTAGDDIIRAVDAGSLSTSDTINGGAGFDTLNIADGAIAGGTFNTATPPVQQAGGSAAPVITNVERINNSDNGGATGASTLNLSAVSGVQQVWSNTAGAFAYTNAALATVFGASGATAGQAQTINIDYTDAQLAGRTTAQLATSNTGVTSDATFVFTGTDATAIEAVSINAVSGNGEVTLDTALTTLDTVSVSGAGRVTVDTAETTITTFDASANTGGVSFTSGALAQAATITGGSGNDVLSAASVSSGTVVATINGGAGNDLITGGAGRDVINGGAGNDVIRGGANGDALTGGAGDDVFSFTALTDSQLGTGANAANTIDMISDFNVGNDTISFAGIDIDAAAGPVETNPGTPDPAGTGAQAFTGLVSAENQILVDNAVNGLAAGSTLAQAVAAVDAQVAEGQVAWFQYGGNTYVFADGNDSDMVIGLTGNVALNATDFQF
ncbi:DUF4214 domain-containing protein [Pseudorhizobium flavum]|uniref:Ca2+-binding RTX toxin-like protein n=1 Tax=Pseudorhizobium flavum TaxID=1335061 RepID=A0A7W9Z1R2_9HYPH|nr:DUF4214 domain-containing protein [Pseudorhizobium flavum]MBB6182425.1 Ca2+-binding RTX toxin-like protein [Pseudorhizobium flavum]CAD6599235.1 hypothetical protein RFYW14_00655 [Pseudorhizobium flavum]